MSANERQVGGDHYDAEYKHWDWVIDTGMGYLEGNATKYVSRNGKKIHPGKTTEESAIDDLEKAIHYIEKTYESALMCLTRRPMLPASWIQAKTSKFCSANQINDMRTRTILSVLANWQTPAALLTTIDDIRELIRRITEHGIVQKTTTKPVPLEDSNKHTPRAPRNHAFESDES